MYNRNWCGQFGRGCEKPRSGPERIVKRRGSYPETALAEVIELNKRAIAHIKAALSFDSEDPQVLVNAVEAYNYLADVSNAEQIIRMARQYGVSLADL